MLASHDPHKSNLRGDWSNYFFFTSTEALGNLHIHRVVASALSHSKAASFASTFACAGRAHICNFFVLGPVWVTRVLREGPALWGRGQLKEIVSPWVETLWRDGKCCLTLAALPTERTTHWAMAYCSTFVEPGNARAVEIFPFVAFLAQQRSDWLLLAYNKYTLTFDISPRECFFCWGQIFGAHPSTGWRKDKRRDQEII
jgi:hypothetical protein